MSYILESLKKSDQQRRQGELPNLQSDHPGGSPPPRRKRPVWPWLVVVALLINAGLLAWWLIGEPPAPGGEAKAVSSPPAPLPEAPAPSAAPMPQQPVAPAAVPVAAPAAAIAGSDPAAREEQPAIPPSNAARAVPSVPGATSVPARPAASPPPAAAPSPAPGAAEPLVTALDDLPASVRSALPELSLSLLYYTAVPEKRLVRLNGHNLREGDAVDAGVVLEEIRPEGAVVSFRGQWILLPRP